MQDEHARGTRARADKLDHALLPMPASPSTSTMPPDPARAAVSAASNVADSCSRSRRSKVGARTATALDDGMAVRKAQGRSP